MSALPRGWVFAPISHIAIYNPKTDAIESTESAFSPMHYLGTNFRDQLGFEIKAWGDIKKAYTHFKNGDVLMAKVTPCFENGKAGIATNLPNGIGAGSSEFMVFRPTAAVLSRYLLGWLSTQDFRRRATVAMTGSVGLKRVPKDFVLEEQIPLAPLSEQQRIAEKLDATLARVDACRERLARVFPILKRFRQSVLAAATSGQLTADWREKRYCHADNDVQKPLGNLGEGRIYQPEAAKTMKRDWSFYPVTTLSQVADSRLGKMLDKVKNSGQLTPYLGNINVRWFSFEIDELQEIRIEEREIDDLSLKKGDVLICEGGEPGRCAIWDLEGSNIIFQKALHRVRPHQEVLLSRWLAYSIKFAAESKRLDEYFTGTTIKHFTGRSLAKFELPLPSLPEQAEIVRRVETLFAFANRLEARLSSAATAAERLTPSLLAKAFRGELIPQDPNDEPASELLQRLAAELESRPKAERANKLVT